MKSGIWPASLLAARAFVFHELFDGVRPGVTANDTEPAPEPAPSPPGNPPQESRSSTGYKGYRRSTRRRLRPPGCEDAEDLLNFAGAICEYAFVLNAKFESFMNRKKETPKYTPQARGVWL